jgi:hypothetical protein
LKPGIIGASVGEEVDFVSGLICSFGLKSQVFGTLGASQAASHVASLWHE